MGSNNGNGAAIADEVRHGRTTPFSARATAAAKEASSVRHGRTAPFSARATAAAKEASSGLKRNRVGHIPLGSSQGGITDIRLKLRRLYKNPPDYMRERESSDLGLFVLGRLVLCP